MKNEKVKFLNENLYKYRKEKGISQEELGNIIGVSRQAVYKWELGERMPDINNLNSLCEYFDKNIEDFIEGANSLLNQIEKEDKNIKKEVRISKIILTIFIIIIILYILTVILKTAFFCTMFMKINKYKDSNNYSYEKKANYYNINNYTNENGEKATYDMTTVDYISYKDKKQKMISLIETSIPIDGLYNTSSTQWYILNGENIEVYSNYEEREKYYYGIDDRMQKNPYEVIEEYAKEFYSLKNILNPFKFINIDFQNKDLVFEINNKRGTAYVETYVKEYIYIDLDTGLLNKIEHYEQDKLVFVYTYFDYEINTTKELQVTLTEEKKKEIIENYNLENSN